MEPHIRFCTSADGTRIAYASVGEGPALVSVPPWAASLETGWEFPGGPEFTESLARGRTLVTFDRRGLGASQREVDDFSLAAQVADVAAVADHLRLDRFDLVGWTDGTPIAVAYAAEHAERVSRLVLWAPFPSGADVAEKDEVQGLVELVRRNWRLGRRAVADIVYPTGPAELQRALSQALRQSVSPEVAAKCLDFFASVDARGYLAKIAIPTLVLHRRGDRNVPIDAGRAAAASIPEARFVALDGDMGDHYHDHAQYMRILRSFLDEGRGGTQAPEVLEPPGLEAGDVYTILFTDIEGSTALTQRLGDAKAQELLRMHNTIVRDALRAYGGGEIKHTGDGIMASFPSASRALECAIAIERAVSERHAESVEAALGVRIGLNAGEPMAEEKDLFGTAVQLARRICDRAAQGEILASDVVRQLAAGKGFLFSDLGETELRGFEDPVRLYEVRWRKND